jgi:TrmH family RNA methyltransferase
MMPISAAEHITSHANPLIKRMRALQRHSERVRQHAFVVEGILPVWRAIEQRAEIEVLVVAPDLLRSADTLSMLDVEADAGRRIVNVSAEIFEQFAGHDNPSGLAAIARIPETGLDDLPVRADSVFTALFEPGNPGNVGTIVRTVEATGGSGVLVIGHATDAYHPTAVKASMGTIFSTPVVRVSDWAAVMAWASAHGLPVISTSAHAHHDHWDTRLPVPGILLLGNEGQGLPAALVEHSDLAVRIPMAAGGSLNLAVAAAVLLYEIRRQHLHRS